MSIKKVKKTEVNKIGNIQSTRNTNNIELENTEGYLKERYYFTDFFDDAKLKSFVKSVEKLVRTSDIYSSFIGSLKEKGLTSCAILGNIVEEEKVTIEMHHYPFTLYDIVMLNVLKKIANKEKFNTMTVAYEVLLDHYNGIISVVPLCKTVHQLVHNGEIFINLLSCYGDINGFLDKYEKSMDTRMKEQYNQIYDMSESGVSYSDADILKKVENYKGIQMNPKELKKEQEKLVNKTDLG